ncbi:hypothetical protein A6A29_09250 [Streptomyces sp. TSRI0281]|nr:hypothetical protein A6A29_09250 [Streptomyces sp. TSRI0281]
MGQRQVGVEAFRELFNDGIDSGRRGDGVDTVVVSHLADGDVVAGEGLSAADALRDDREDEQRCQGGVESDEDARRRSRALRGPAHCHQIAAKSSSGTHRARRAEESVDLITQAPRHLCRCNRAARGALRSVVSWCH